MSLIDEMREQGVPEVTIRRFKRGVAHKVAQFKRQEKAVEKAGQAFLKANNIKSHDDFKHLSKSDQDFFIQSYAIKRQFFHFKAYRLGGYKSSTAPDWEYD